MISYSYMRKTRGWEVRKDTVTYTPPHLTHFGQSTHFKLLSSQGRSLVRPAPTTSIRLIRCTGRTIPKYPLIRWEFLRRTFIKMILWSILIINTTTDALGCVQNARLQGVCLARKQLGMQPIHILWVWNIYLMWVCSQRHCYSDPVPCTWK